MFIKEYLNGGLYERGLFQFPYFQFQLIHFHVQVLYTDLIYLMFCKHFINIAQMHHASKCENGHHISFILPIMPVKIYMFHKFSHF